VKISFRQLLGNVGRHGRQVDQPPLLDLRLGDAHFLPLIVDDRHDLSFVVQQQARGRLAVTKRHERAPERGVDVAVRRQHIFEQSIDPALADPVEIGTDFGSLALQPVAGCTRFREYLGAARRIMLPLAETGQTCRDQLPCLFVLVRQIGDQFVAPLFELRRCQ
jgi:hypothetical protein